MVFFAAVIVEWNLELVGESVDDGRTNAKTGEGTWPAHVGYCGDVMPVGVIFLQLIMDKSEDFFGHFVSGLPFISLVVKLEDTGVGRGVKVEFHRFSSLEWLVLAIARGW